ncbi:MAG: hypothetical protein IRY90_16970, partial [Actinomadura rubrobrunea]|nr:hypothetical protein [Actinomadura rubrobrunea]
MTRAGPPERPHERQARAPDPAAAEPVPGLFEKTPAPAPPRGRRRAAGPAWIVLPARAVALLVAVPLRLLY